MKKRNSLIVSILFLLFIGFILSNSIIASWGSAALERAVSGGSGHYFISAVMNGSEVVKMKVGGNAGLSNKSGRLQLDKAVYAPMEEISVSFLAGKDFAENAWIGIVPLSVPHGSEVEADKEDLSYQYIQKRVEGVFLFTAPAVPGTYDMRMFDTDNNGKEIAYVTFTVTGGQTQPMLKLNKTVFSPGEEIHVQFTASGLYDESAWVGVIPSGVPHGDEEVCDKEDLAYIYIRKLPSGTIVFAAPAVPGKYDIRMFDSDNNGKESAYVNFVVTGGEGQPALRIQKTVFSPGEKINVFFTAPVSYAENAWVGIIPSNVPHGDEVVCDGADLAYLYISKQSSGTMVFTAPNTLGYYDLRMFDTDNGGKETASISFIVK